MLSVLGWDILIQFVTIEFCFSERLSCVIEILSCLSMFIFQLRQLFLEITNLCLIFIVFSLRLLLGIQWHLETFCLLSGFGLFSLLLWLELSDTFDQFVHLDQGVIIVFFQLLVKFQYLDTLYLLPFVLFFPYFFIWLKLFDRLIPFIACFLVLTGQISDLLVQFGHNCIFLRSLVL